MSTPKTVWISDAVVAAISIEANRFAPRETGGILLGYWPDPPVGPVVTDFIGPGPQAVHERYRFIPDHEFHIAEMERVYFSSNGRLQYLGDWHTHPEGTAVLSHKDRTTFRRIARDPEARAPMPLMVILTSGPNWMPTVWLGQLRYRRFLWPRFEVEKLQIHTF